MDLHQLVIEFVIKSEIRTFVFITYDTINICGVYHHTCCTSMRDFVIELVIFMFKSKIYSESRMEKASQLIVGYIRNSRLHFSSSNCINNCLCDNRMELICGLHTNIPLAIISIITHFYPKMNGKLFCWHIDNPNIIKNFINAKHKQRFASDIFEMKNLKWYLSAYPNGDRKEGSCTV